jgi:nucleotide-binding universal stress UspA family protein
VTSATQAPRSILVPVTLAEDCVEAVAVAAALAAPLGAELVLVGIAPLASPAPTLDLGWRSETPAQLAGEQKLVDRIVAERLQELADALPPSVRARTRVTWGPVGAALVAAAADERADLVVVPIRREGELAHLIHDHADRYVLHHSDVPVLVVPTDGRAAPVG